MKIGRVLISAEQIEARLAEMGAQITADYRGKDLLLVAVLKGAFMVMADLSRYIALPVDMDVTSQAQLPRLALVIVTDKSGSMQGTVPTGETKLDVVKSAALSVLELLNPFDRVGLLAFDADWEWTVPVTEARNREQIAADLATLQSGGGTVLYFALEEAFRELAGIEAAVKHVIVLSDGLTNPGEFEQLARAMRAAKITVSTVAVGDDADVGMLRELAAAGGPEVDARPPAHAAGAACH